MSVQDLIYHGTTSMQTLHPAQSKLSLPRPLCSAPPFPDPLLRYTESDSIALDFFLIPGLVVEYRDGSDSYTAIRFPFLGTKRFSSHISWKLPGNMSPVTDFIFASFRLGFWCWEKMISMDRSTCQLPCDYMRFRFQKRCRMFDTTICTKSMKPIDKNPKCPPEKPIRRWWRHERRIWSSFVFGWPFLDSDTCLKVPAENPPRFFTGFEPTTWACIDCISPEKFTAPALTLSQPSRAKILHSSQTIYHFTPQRDRHA